VVEIDAQGWRLLSESPVRFRRSRGMHALPTPIAGGQIEDLRQFLNIKEEDDWNLVISWLLAALRPQGPYPILIWNGEQGNCKSTSSKVVRALTDPNKVGLSSAPEDRRDLFIVANGSWII